MSEKKKLTDALQNWEENDLKRTLDRFPERKEKFTTGSGMDIDRVSIPESGDEEQYMEKLGFNYTAEKPSEDTRPTFNSGITVNEKNEFITVGVTEDAYNDGLREGDVLLEALEEEINMESIRQIAMKAFGMNVGDPITYKVLRGDEELTIETKLVQRKVTHIFEEMEELTPEQKAFREVWTTNLAM